MRKRRIGIIDLVAKAPTRALFARVMNANLASIMPQVVGVWCEEAGHEVHLVCYTGFEDLTTALPDDIDVLFISAFSEAAQLAYAVSNRFRSKGVVTVLGGPHARCYPQDAQKYFDYVFGFTDKALLRDMLHECAPHRPLGVRMEARQQPESLPGVQERWKYIDATLKKAPMIKMIPMIGSLGCPYTCSFCIDATIPYQPLNFDLMRDDLRFLLTKMKRPLVGWHDPNFGVRFDDFMDTIEEAIPHDRIDFIAESSLSLLGENNLKRLHRNGFKGVLPGIESWFQTGNKSMTGKRQGMDKVQQVAEHVNTILRYIPYVQCNFVLGLDEEMGAEPFELTKRFMDLTPGAFPGYSLLTSFGQAAHINLEYQKENRIIPFPFHFLNNNQAMNIRPKQYLWKDFYDHVVDLTKYSFSWRSIGKRLLANSEMTTKWMNVVRAVSSEGFGRIRYHKEMRERLDTDVHFKRFLEQDSTELPPFMIDHVRRQLGSFWHWLPDGAMQHDPNAYLSESMPLTHIHLNGNGRRNGVAVNGQPTGVTEVKELDAKL